MWVKLTHAGKNAQIHTRLHARSLPDYFSCYKIHARNEACENTIQLVEMYELFPVSKIISFVLCTCTFWTIWWPTWVSWRFPAELKQHGTRTDVARHWTQNTVALVDSAEKPQYKLYQSLCTVHVHGIRTIFVFCKRCICVYTITQ